MLGNPPWDPDAKRPVIPGDHAGKPLFEPGDKALFEDTKSRLDAAGDGLDYTIYGYPSGIFGLRLFFNPDFFGPGKGPASARAYWTHQVLETHDRYYTDPKITVDPKLVRPFRVSVSCGFCHIGPHPLNPPADREAPDWANLSSNIGAQYWKPQPAFGNLQTPNSFLFHFWRANNRVRWTPRSSAPIGAPSGTSRSMRRRLPTTATLSSTSTIRSGAMMWTIPVPSPAGPRARSTGWRTSSAAFSASSPGRTDPPRHALFCIGPPSVLI